jgi:hypothetical protein
MNLAQPAVNAVTSVEVPKPSMTKVAVFNMEKNGVAQMNTTMKSPDDAYPTFD